MEQESLFNNVEFKEINVNSSSLDYLTENLKSLWLSNDLFCRLEAGKIIDNITTKKLFKSKYKSFKEYCSKNDFDYNRCYRLRNYNELESFIKKVKSKSKPLPSVIQYKDLVNAIRYKSVENILLLWELCLYRYKSISVINFQNIFDTAKLINEDDTVTINENDSLTFINYVFKYFFNSSKELKNKSIDLQNRIETLTSENESLKHSSKNSDKYLINELKNQITFKDLEIAILKNKVYNLECQLINKNNSSSKSPYDVLRVNKISSKEDIKKAFRKLSSDYHSDKINYLKEYVKDPNQFILIESMFNEKFKEVKTAYETLK